MPPPPASLFARLLICWLSVRLGADPPASAPAAFLLAAALRLLVDPAPVVEGPDAAGTTVAVAATPFLRGAIGELKFRNGAANVL